MNGHETWLKKTIMIDNPIHEQLDRIEAKLDKLLARKKRVVKPRASKSEYGAAFEFAWLNYPKRAGSNPKNKAAAAYQKRVDEGSSEDALLFCVQDYCAFCDATQKTGTELVMQASRFFGPNREFENDWTIPKPKADPYAKPDVYSQAHQAADFSGKAEALLDPVDPYADLK